jgi:transporter family-2 protein
MDRGERDWRNGHCNASADQLASIRCCGTPIVSGNDIFCRRVGVIARGPAQPAATLRQHSLGSAPWWAWIGGALGAFYIVMSIYLIPRIGAAALLSAVVLGQVVFSLLADHFGFFGVNQHPVTVPRLAGVVLVIVGVALVRLF